MQKHKTLFQALGTDRLHNSKLFTFWKEIWNTPNKGCVCTLHQIFIFLLENLWTTTQSGIYKDKQISNHAIKWNEFLVFRTFKIFKLQIMYHWPVLIVSVYYPTEVRRSTSILGANGIFDLLPWNLKIRNNVYTFWQNSRKKSFKEKQ